MVWLIYSINDNGYLPTVVTMTTLLHKLWQTFIVTLQIPSNKTDDTGEAGVASRSIWTLHCFCRVLVSSALVFQCRIVCTYFAFRFDMFITILSFFWNKGLCLPFWCHRIIFFAAFVVFYLKQNLIVSNRRSISFLGCLEVLWVGDK